MKVQINKITSIKEGTYVMYGTKIIVEIFTEHMEIKKEILSCNLIYIY